MATLVDASRLVLVPLCALAAVATVDVGAAKAQRGYYAAIAFSPSTGRMGHSAREARSEQQAKDLAMQRCGIPDARVYTWARDQWVAVATVDGVNGTAGFARGFSAEEAQAKALAECGKRANGRAYRVALCIHSSGMRPRELRSVAAIPVKSKTGYFAAIAYSPSTGRIGSTSGEAKTKETAHQLAIQRCKAPDAKVWMWGDGWIAIALSEDGAGTAGFGPGETRKAAEDAALAQCRKQAHGAACRIALSLFSATKPATLSALPAGGEATTTPAESGGVTPASASEAAPATPAN